MSENTFEMDDDDENVQVANLAGIIYNDGDALA